MSGAGGAAKLPRPGETSGCDSLAALPARLAALSEPVRAAQCVHALAGVARVYAGLGMAVPAELLEALRLQLERLLVALRAEGWA